MAPNDMNIRKNVFAKIDVEKCQNFSQALLDGREQVLSVRQKAEHPRCPLTLWYLPWYHSI
jgi:hypothetical protein